MMTKKTKRDKEHQEKEQDRLQDRVKARGVGLRESEWNRLEEIAGELGVTRHNLMLYVLRDFIRRYEAGYRPETETKTTLKMPN